MTSGMIVSLMWIIGATGLLIAAGCIFLEWKACRRLTCRVCSEKLDRRGGYNAGMHGGFCVQCATRIMREVRKS